MNKQDPQLFVEMQKLVQEFVKYTSDEIPLVLMYASIVHCVGYLLFISEGNLDAALPWLQTAKDLLQPAVEKITDKETLWKPNFARVLDTYCRTCESLQYALEDLKRKKEQDVVRDDFARALDVLNQFIDACHGCQERKESSGKPLLRCSKCKFARYCSKKVRQSVIANALVST
jgi:hypothetical protein